MEGFESCVEAERFGSRFYIEKGTRTVNAPSFYCIDVMAVLPTGFGKSLIFQMFAMMCRVKKKTKTKKKEEHASRVSS